MGEIEEKSLRYSGIISREQYEKSQAPGVFGQTSSMLGRVFRPLRSPLKAHVYILTNCGDTGFIGLDKTYQFSEHLRSEAGKPLGIAQKDFYVRVEASLRQDEVPLVLRIIEWVLKKVFFFLQPPESSCLFSNPYLPSTLFYGAREGDHVSYLADGRPIELILNQQSHHLEAGKTNFEDFFHSLEAYIQLNEKRREKPLYLFVQDRPVHVQVLDFKELSEKATVYLPQTGEQVAVSTELLKEFDQYSRNQSQPFPILEGELREDGSAFFCLAASAMKAKDIKVLIDGYSLIVIGDRGTEYDDRPGVRYIQKQISRFCRSEIRLDQAPIDPQSVKLVCRDGAAYLTFKTLPLSRVLLEGEPAELDELG
jgi:hypothetical protein